MEKNMGKKILRSGVNRLLAGVGLLVVMILTISITNLVVTYASDANTKFVTDDASLFTESEAKKLETNCRKASDACKTDIFIVTLYDGKTESQLNDYLKQLMAANGYGYDDTSATLSPNAIGLAVDMKSRKYRITATGNAKSDISQSDMDDMLSSVQKKLTNGSYYKAGTVFIDSISSSMNKSLTYRMTKNLPIKLAIAAGVATVVVIIMMLQARAKMTVDSRTYTKDHGYNIHRKEDHFINTTVVKRHIERSSSSSGGGHSSGGNSGGGGGSF